MLNRMLVEWDKALAERKSRIEDLEGTIEDLVGEQRIPDATVRGRLEDVQEELTLVYRSILATACKILGVPLIMKQELHRLLDGNYAETRAMLEQMLTARTTTRR